MVRRVVWVRPLDGYALDLVFDNGERRIFDCSPLLDFGVFGDLANSSYFRKIRVRDGTIVWPHEQDICPDILYHRSLAAPIEYST